MSEKNISQNEAIQQRFKELGLKTTHSRIAIFKALLASETHPTAEELLKKVQRHHPSISMSTVYKTLETFVENGLANRVTSAGFQTRFDAKTHQHSHLFCEKTGKLLDYEDGELHQLLENYFKQKQINNFKVSDIQIQINGEFLNQSKS